MKICKITFRKYATQEFNRRMEFIIQNLKSVKILQRTIRIDDGKWEEIQIIASFNEEAYQILLWMLEKQWFVSVEEIE